MIISDLYQNKKDKNNDNIVHAVREGFTLMEVMIAIAIVAIIAAVIGPGLFRYLETAKKSNAKSTIRVFEGAITLYQAQVRQFPTNLRDLVKPPREEQLRKRWEGPYIQQKEIPSDPWGNKYQYRITPQGENPYELYSYGPKGKGAPKIEWLSVWDEG